MQTKLTQETKFVGKATYETFRGIKFLAWWINTVMFVNMLDFLTR